MAASVTTARRVEQFAPWALRLAWLGVAAAGGRAVAGAVEGRTDAVDATATWGAALVWAAGVAAMVLPSVVGLTSTRAIVPLSIGAAVVAWSAGADTIDGVLFLAVAALATLVAASGELGRAFVQASAYGEEDRHLLRPPAAYLAVVVASWLVWAAALLGGPLLLAARQWVAGAALAALALGGAVWAWPRWHRLARRWFVIVPAGVVLHDHLVLAETLMLRRQEIAGLALAPAGTDAADLTGPAAGHAIEITTSESVTAVLAASPGRPGGTAIHLTACLVAPTRPGRALHAAAGRRLPVG